MSMLRIIGSETWIGVDLEDNTLYMKKEGRFTTLADFRSTAAAELMELWLETIASKFSPARQQRKVWGIF